MSGARRPEDHLEAALHLLEYAVAGDDVRRALQALAELGRAAEAHGWAPLLAAPDAPATTATRAARVRELAAAAPDLLARAASSAVSLVRRYAEDGVLDALYARSGYQTLLDAEVWPAPVRGPGDFGDVEEDLAEEVGEVDLAGVRPPPSPPASHPWWSLLER